jgi:hypothetical protein
MYAKYEGSSDSSVHEWKAAVLRVQLFHLPPPLPAPVCLAARVRLAAQLHVPAGVRLAAQLHVPSHKVTLRDSCVLPGLLLAGYIL